MVTTGSCKHNILTPWYKWWYTCRGVIDWASLAIRDCFISLVMPSGGISKLTWHNQNHPTPLPSSGLLAVVKTLTHHFWLYIHCCKVLLAPSILLVSFSLSSVCKRFHGFASWVQNQKFSPLCFHQEEHYELPNRDGQILYLINTPGMVKEHKKRKIHAFFIHIEGGNQRINWLPSKAIYSILTTCLHWQSIFYSPLFIFC